MKGKFPASFDTYQIVTPGDFVFCLFDVQETPRTVGLSQHNGMITGAYDVYRLRSNASARFIAWQMESFDNVKALQPLYRGLRNTLPRAAFEGLRIALPSPEEQALIVRFLDNAELRILRAIQAKERLLDLLIEQRLAVFESVIAQHAFVRELVPGPNWFGDIPATWNEKRLRGVLSESKSRSSSGAEPHYSMSQRLGLVPARVGGGVLLSADYVGGRICAEGDIVLNRLKAHLGVFAVAPTLCVISPDYTVLRVRDGSSPEFICALFRSRVFRPQLRINVRGLVEGFWRLYTPDLMRLSIPVPPRNIQDSIMAEVDAQWSRLDTAMRAVREEIELLREYRIKLISDVVTGKKDVRTEAAGMKDLDPAELARVLGGTTETGNDGAEGDDDAE